MQRSFRLKGRKVTAQSARMRIGIAVAEFNADITDKLLAGALRELERSGVRRGHITAVRVPGSFELPFACQRMAESGRCDALIALGCVIKGETDHHRYVAGEAARGIMEVMLAHSIPIGFGVLTTDTLAQAKARVSGAHNKGAEAARAALRVLREI